MDDLTETLIQQPLLTATSRDGSVEVVRLRFLLLPPEDPKLTPVRDAGRLSITRTTASRRDKIGVGSLRKIPRQFAAIELLKRLEADTTRYERRKGHSRPIC